MSSLSRLSDEESFQLALAISLSDAQQPHRGGRFESHRAAAFATATTHTAGAADISRDEVFARRLQRELQQQDAAGEGGGTHGRGTDAFGRAQADGAQAAPFQRREESLLGQPPGWPGVGSLLDSLKKLPTMRRAGAAVLPALPPPAGVEVFMGGLGAASTP